MSVVMKREQLISYFEKVELTKSHTGYFFKVSEAISIILLGSLCGLDNVKQIHQWATSKSTREFLKEEFAINKVPCYYWLLCLLKIVEPTSLNKCLMKWSEQFLPQDRKNLTIALDGKTVRSTAKMESYESPLHIVSAQLSELGITFASKSVESKSNEIPAVQELIRELDIRGCMVVADALNCQTETASAIIAGKGDYLLDVKGNQLLLKEEIEEYIQDETLRKTMEHVTTIEKNHGRIETRTAFSTSSIDWLYGKEKWEHLSSIGAIKKVTEKKGIKTQEWHYYISSRKLTPSDLLHHARMEWAVESMHWLLDIHFCEDSCRILNRNIQENLNLCRKLAFGLIKIYKTRTNSKKAISNIMFGCLLNSADLLLFFEN